MPEDREFKIALDRLESGTHPPAECSTEVQWHAAWMAENITALEPLTMALLGGALADRLAWVFHAGYQGMMRYAFPFCPRTGWASYLVAEDKTGEFPGTVVTRSEGHTTLSGYKSWVAASEHVDHLVVRVTATPEEDILVLVDSTAPGVVLSSRDKPGFLAELSQGFAAFEDVSISDDRVFTTDHLPPNFAQSEPLHVLVALNAFMIAHTLNLEADASILTQATDSLRLADDLVEQRIVGDDFFLGVADLDAATSETARLFEVLIESRDDELFARWQKDRGVVNMFSRGLQKRAKWLREY
jgi:hypothetical protein